MTPGQEAVFSAGEGDAWFRRNRAHLGGQQTDWVSRLVAAIDGRDQMQRVCELGCANGWRLERLRPMFSPTCLFAGMDASHEAIAAGTGQFPDLDLRQGVLSRVPYDEPFDLIIVNFVLHWIDRDLLAVCIAEIDRMVKRNGYLVLGDFLPNAPMRRHYHHLPGQQVYTYKQDYARTFLGLGFYNELTRVTHSHGPAESGLENWIAPVAEDERVFVSVLHKSSETYAEK